MHGTRLPFTTVGTVWTAVAVVLLLSACRPSAEESRKGREDSPSGVSSGQKARKRRANRSVSRPAPGQASNGARNESLGDAAPAATPRSPGGQQVNAPPPFQAEGSHSPAKSATAPDPTGSSNQVFQPVDESRLATAGIRTLTGKHITIFTDVGPAPAVDELPRVFDLAIRPWCEYFGVRPESASEWNVRAYLMDDREAFETAGLLPRHLPRFLHGYSQQGQLWLFDQPSDYYRRHLLLHEGTHLFMQTYLDGMGPPWYSEGMAELLGTHHWHDGELQLCYFPHSRDEVPYWGRIKIVQTQYAAGRRLSLEEITQFGPTAHLEIEPYGWCWAVAAFLDGHPQFSERFHQLAQYVGEPPRHLTRHFHALFRPDRRQLIEQWQLFVANLEYGYDIRREAISYDASASEHDAETVVEIRADRGWQSTGVVVSPGTTYALEASGRYQLARQPKIWWCEPGGVTIRYHGGYPLGMLLAGVSDQTQPLRELTPLADPVPIGLGRELRFERQGTLFLRVNDSPADLRNNSGTVRVELR